MRCNEKKASLEQIALNKHVKRNQRLPILVRVLRARFDFPLAWCSALRIVSRSSRCSGLRNVARQTSRQSECAGDFSSLMAGRNECSDSGFGRSAHGAPTIPTGRSGLRSYRVGIHSVSLCSSRIICDGRYANQTRHIRAEEGGEQIALPRTSRISRCSRVVASLTGTRLLAESNCRIPREIFKYPNEER